MSISAESHRFALSAALGHVIAALLCAGFGAVYEQFSHQVYSYWMIYAFALPLLLGACPLLILALMNVKVPALPLTLWNGGVAWLSVGSIFLGVLEIYGTTNRWWWVYPVMGALLLAAGLVSCCIASRSQPHTDGNGLL